jgi:glycosyltransferase involved in cell wall biosynthesis
LGLHALARHERGRFSVDAVYRRLDRRVARRLRGEGLGELKAVYGYEDGSVDTFAAARERGLQRIYDLPIGYWRAAQRIYREEAEREPTWAATIEGVLDSDEKLARKESEVATADLILVASRFTAETLREAPAQTARVEVVPYGAPIAGGGEPPREAATPGVLRAIFVGALTQRKGLSYALEAVRRLGPRCELTLIGARPTAPCAPLDEALRRHRWFPNLSSPEVLTEMRRHDVLLFPSLCEGFGLVILEALSCGLPVISTNHTGAPDVLGEGIDGFIVPIRSADAIAQKMEALLDSPPRLAAMKDAAAAKARALRWEDYRSTIARIVRAQLAGATPSRADTLPR